MAKMEVARLEDGLNQQRNGDCLNQQEDRDRSDQQEDNEGGSGFEEPGEEESGGPSIEEDQMPPKECLPKKRRKIEMAMHGQDPSVADDSVDTDEMNELIANITSVSHTECDTWVVDGDYISCLIDQYQKDVVDTLRRRELKKTDPADTMISAGTFSPWHPTDRMVKVFTHRRLRKIQESPRKDLDSIDIDDRCIQNAIRHKMNNNATMAIQELGTLQDCRLRMLFEHLIMNLPRKGMEMQSEETLVVSNIAPILKTFVNHVDDDIYTHFPNTESTIQKKQGLKADRPDFKILIGDREAPFGEVTGRSQRADKAKNGWDLWRLVRFRKSVLDEGAPMVPLIHIIYDEGTIYRHFVKIRGVMVLAEVGVFTVPMHLNSLSSLQASLPVLNWCQEAVKWLEHNREWAKRSWKAANLQNIKKYHC
ncbi:hypothetical protein BGZ47_001878 [Haplosporangium gracile]|nr:hypothetical protein BGZ47_001878 [Haplosporangium gracile]